MLFRTRGEENEQYGFMDAMNGGGRVQGITVMVCQGLFHDLPRDVGFMLKTIGPERLRGLDDSRLCAAFAHFMLLAVRRSKIQLSYSNVSATHLSRKGHRSDSKQQ